MPTIVSLKPVQLENRLDADYYGPGFLANHDRLVRSGIRTARLRSLVKLGRRAVYFSTDTMQANEAPKSWIPFLTADDLSEDGCSINLDAQRRVSPAFAAEYPNGILRENELLVKVKGPNQTTAYNSHKPNRDVLISGTIWGALVDLASVDPHFLVAVLTSPYGATARTRLRTNTNIEFLAPDDLLGVLLPWPRERLVQQFIGDKLRQAEKLRKYAGTVDEDFSDTIRHQYPEVFGGQKEFGRSSRVFSASLRRDLNPGAFNPERLRIRSEIKKAGGRELIEIASIEASVTDSFGPEDDYIGLDSVSSTTSQLTPVKIAQAEVEGAARVLREGPIISKLRPYLNKVSYIPAELARAVGSTELLCIVPKPGVSGWFLYGVLKLQCTVQQFQPLANGSTLPRINAADVLEVVVPWHDDSNQLGQNLELAQAMYFAAEKLTTTAKHLVDALIEGKVTEADIITAQEALELGNRSADRALLSRLTRRGIDVLGQPPLFPDLDALYALLDQTKMEEIQ